jgi:hypothetical protein
MNPQEFFSLQEAYLEVVMNEGKKSFPFDEVSNKIKSKQEKQQQLEKDVESGFISKKRAISLSSKLGNQRVKMGMTYAKERMKKKEEDNLKRSPTFYRKDKHLSKMTKTQKEQVDIYDIILSHLLDEGYAETQEAAEVIMVNMSEEWRDSIVEEENLQEMRKEDKVAGKKKTPLMVPGKRGTIQRAPEGSQRKWEKITPEVGNPAVSSGRYRQGARGGSELGYKRHPHGGEHGGMKKGSMRGVSRMDTQQARRAGPIITPAQKVSQRRAKREQQLRDY